MIMESRDVQEEFPKTSTDMGLMRRGKNDSEPDSLREDWAAWTRVRGGAEDDSYHTGPCKQNNTKQWS